MLGVALNEVFVPLLQKQFPEIVDFYLPPEGCSYRMAVVSIKKQYPGHAKRVMFGIWSFLRQFMYTKFIIVVDDDIDIRDWKEVIWAMTTRMDADARHDAGRRNTPIDYLDFRQPVAGLGQDGAGRDQQVAGRNQPRMGAADRHGCLALCADGPESGQMSAVFCRACCQRHAFPAGRYRSPGLCRGDRSANRLLGAGR
jgi:hypothetical protein